MLISLSGFKGELPRLSPRLLPQQYAGRAANIRFEDGTLKPICESTVTATVAAGTTTIYRHAETWLAFPEARDIIPGPVATDRLYMSDGATPPKLYHDGAEYDLALPAPTGAPTLVNASAPDADLLEDVLFCYTYVTSLGEESARSPIAAISTDNAVTVTVSGFSAAPAGRLISAIRIYRSITSVEGITDFYFAAEIPVAQSSYDHDIAATPLQEVIPTKDFAEPPAGLHGLTPMPNGMIAGFVANKVYFCEPYQPHAWPEKYVLAVDHDIVGLAAFGTYLIALTEGTPYRMQGTHPEAMVSEKIEMNLPCVSKASIVDMGYSALYASAEGLVEITTDNARVVTKSMFSKQDWYALQPATIRATEYRQAYLFAFDGGLPGGSEKMATIMMVGDDAWLVRYSETPDAFFHDRQAGALYILVGDEIRRFDDITAGDGLATRATALWRSKEIVLPAPATFGAVMIEAEEEGGTFAARVYGDGVLRDTIATTDTPERLSSGFLASRWHIEVEGTRQVSSIRLADEMQSLWAGGG